MNGLQSDLAKTVRPLYRVNKRGVLEQFASGTFIQVEKSFFFSLPYTYFIRLAMVIYM
jgi:hypothetical protein